MKKIILFFSFIFLSITLNAEINLNISKSSIGIDESFFLDFILTDKTQEKPDFSPLQGDFKVVSQSQNHSTSIINGRLNVETRWHLVLRPKHEGRLTIPSISFGNDFSLPKTIEVTAADTSRRDESLYLESEILPKGNIYEQSQFVYVVRLYRAVNLAQASLSELKTNDPDTIIERLGTDHEYEMTHPNGVRYLVIERKYAVSPQHSGELTFAPIIFEGEVIKSRNLFFNVETDFKQVSSKEVVVYVNPIPAPFSKNNWLAANDVKLTEEWSTDPAQLTVGEPITWTLTLTADRCMGRQIPEFALDLPNTIKTYRDKTEVNNLIGPQGFTGIKKLKVALIATKPGEISLPEISIPWWDMKTNRIRKTTLANRVIQVKEGLIAMNSQTVEPIVSTVSLQETSETSTELPHWVWALVAVNVILILSFIGNKFQNVFRKLLDKIPSPSRRKHIKKQLKQACYANDAKQAEIHLLAWFRVLHPEASSLNLMAIKSYVSPSIQDAISELNAALYGTSQSWDGRALWKAVKGFKRY